MKRRKTRPAEAALEPLRRRIASLDSRSIDQLYGLEPVYEPGVGSSGGLVPEEFVPVRCPYCGERLETRVDLTADEPAYVEDCQVCCKPNLLKIAFDREIEEYIVSAALES